MTRRRVSRRAVSTAIAALALSGVVSAEPPATGFVVIVHPRNPSASVDRAFVADAFLKKTTRWSSGDVIRPVDLPPRSATRSRFSESVLKRSVASVRTYWQQMIFSGRDVPPPELADEDSVVRYVATHADAIGYVSPETRLEGARVLRVVW